MMSLMDKSQMVKPHIQGKSNRGIAGIMKVSRNTANKYVKEYGKLQVELARCDPEDKERVRELAEAITAEPTYDSSRRGFRKWDAEMDALPDEILAAEEEKRQLLGPDKQMLANKQVHELILEAGHDIGATTVSRHIRGKRGEGGEAYIAQKCEYGQRFEHDFGEAKPYIAGRLRRIQMAVMCAPASDVKFALLYDDQKQDVFLDPRVRFFEFMGGTFEEGAYGNMRNVVRKFIGRNEKELNPGLLKLAACYAFAINVTNCFAGWEKGAVESSVKVIRNKAFATKYRFDTIEGAQAHLDAVLADMNEGRDIAAERAALRPLPPRYETADVRERAAVDKYSCVTVGKNRYSVPEGLVGKGVKVKAYPNEIVVACRGEIVARHARMEGSGGMRLDIRHHLGTLRRKPGALARSEVLAGYPTFKRPYDAHYSDRPREFVEAVRAYAGSTAAELESEPLACATPVANPAARRTMAAIESAAAAQMARAAEIRKAAA